MAFEKVNKVSLYKRSISNKMKVSITKSGAVYLGTSILREFPITQQHKTADLYFDIDTNQVAVEPKEDGAGQFHITNQFNSVQIHCSAFLNGIGVWRGQGMIGQIKNVRDSKMIVFKVNREKAKDDE